MTNDVETNETNETNDPNYAARVRDLFFRCLFEPGEPTDAAVIVEGLTTTFGFHPERIRAAKAEIRALADALVTDPFRKDQGGGMSFLKLCEDRAGRIWGEHKSCQELACLAIGAGLASWCAPRELWRVLPGGMPYIVFDLGPEAGAS